MQAHPLARRNSYALALSLVSLCAGMLLVVSPAAAAPTSVTVVGSMQSEAGCAGDWDPACATTHMTFDATDTVWQYSLALLAGNYEYKAAIDDSWAINYGANGVPGGGNIALNLAVDSTVKFYYSDDTHWITDNQTSRIAVAVGSFQSELGCSGDWQPDCLRSWLQDVDGDGTFTFSTTAIPPGAYEGKVAINEGWGENYGAGGAPGGANIPFTVAAAGQTVNFSFVSSTNVLTITPVPIGGAIDDNVLWDDLFHDSRDPLYRTPSGPVTAGTPVVLRFRSASNDLTAARVRVWDDRNNVQLSYTMTKVATESPYDYWEVTLPSTLPTIFWYRFIAQDGTAVAYYEDDAARLGGAGQAYGTSQDRSWQLTVYDPAFTTPDWVKNAVVYQIFPDRFRDGTPGNNPSDGTFFYDEPGGTVTRSLTTSWNTPICDPRSAGSCAGTYSRNFYGGDLQGIIDKLDYLKALGVTAIYLNPVFKSPSNHKYDTSDYGEIDPGFGDLATFQALATEAHNRGMHLILDGVFNHSSSDSSYFDRYSRYATTGACESIASPFRAWYFFSGTGPCAGQGYTSWFGYDSLPKLNSSSSAVRDLIFAGGSPSPSSAIARYWLAQGADGWRLDVGGDVDPGLTNDPANDYWEDFRTAVRAEKPGAYITGEEWGNASPWVLGNEWDAVMNYQLSSALLSFWRDTTFTDNDHNAGTSAGPLAPLTPSQLDERLRNLEERYPAESLQAMMNLLGSHDTNRALYLLDENAGVGNPTLYQNANYDWSGAIQRLKGVALLQMTLPGAPTIYYGDEVGLAGPPASSSGQWEDDPYNRQPYPWLDQSGTPFYTHLQLQASQDAIADYYKLLTGARNGHAALRTGDLRTLKIDDANKVYAYGRKLADDSDAAVILVNRTTSAQDITVDLGGYLPNGAVFEDVLNGNASYTVSGGQLTVSAVRAMNGALLVLSGALSAPPAAVTDLAAVGAASVVNLSWGAIPGATEYDVYRSLVSGGGYALIGTASSNSYSDTTVSNAIRYYYVVVSRDTATGSVSGFSNEATAVPQWTLGWYNLQWPPTLNHTLGVTPTVNIYGQVYISGATNASASQVPGVIAQVGFGPDTAHTGPTWAWSATTFNGEAGNNDEYVGKLLPTQTGVYNYLYRYSVDGGTTWSYGGTAGPLSGADYGVMTVSASSDTTPPAAPLNLAVTYTASDLISLKWDASPDADLGGYELYRKLSSDSSYALLATVPAGTTTYNDYSVVSGSSYDYYVLAFDTGYNRSGSSNVVTATAVPRNVAVTFNVTIPASTPASETAYIAGSIPGLPAWNPGATPMTRTGATTFAITLSILEGSSLEYKYTRGAWERVEKQVDGNAEVANRAVTVQWGTDGTQTVNDTVANWRDPIVSAFTPASGAGDLPDTTVVTAAWNQGMPGAAGSCITLTGPGGAVAGIVTYDAGTMQYTFTPSAPLARGQYTVGISGCVDAGGDAQQLPASWSFFVLAPAGSADLSITKTLVTAAPFTQGQEITYTLVVANAGPADATAVEVTDTPTNLTITSVSGAGCTALPCTIASLASGANATITVTATIDAAGAFDNSASVTAAESDPDSTGNTDASGNGGAAAAAIVIPTLGIWALALLGVALGLLGVLRLRGGL